MSERLNWGLIGGGEGSQIGFAHRIGAELDGKFKFAGSSFGKILDGIGLNKDRPVLNTAIIAALNSIFVDGTYSNLLKKWNLEGASL